MSNDPSNGTEVADLSIDAKNAVIASDRTGGGEQRHGLVDSGSSASDDPETKDRSILAAAPIAAAAVVSRRRLDPVAAGLAAVLPALGGRGKGLDPRAGDEEHQGARTNSAHPGRGHARRVGRALVGCSGSPGNSVLSRRRWSSLSTKGSAGGWRDKGRVGEAPVGPEAAAGNAIRR